MTTEKDATGGAPWRPDGTGLDDLRDVIEDVGEVVHLRLSAPGRHPRTACDGAGGSGIDHWWTGIPTEVNCPSCLEVVHA
jgi:hypothetical protein